MQMLVAVITLAGVLVTGALAYLAAVRAAEIPVEATKAQQLDDRRREVYVKFLTTVLETRNAIEERAVLGRAGQDAAGAIEEKNRYLLDRIHGLEEQMSGLRIYAGADPLVRAMKVHNALLELIDFATKDVAIRAPIDAYQQGLSKLDSAVAEFEHAVRVEMHVPSD